MQQQTFNDNVANIMNEIRSIDVKSDGAQKQFFDKIQNYDKYFNNSHQMGSQFQATKNIAQLNETQDIEKFRKHSFVADGSLFGSYQNLMRQAKVPTNPPPPPPPPPKIDPQDQISKIFMRVPNNFQDQNANSKQINRHQQSDHRYPTDSIYGIQNPVFQCNSDLFYRQQVQMMLLQQQNIPAPVPEDPDMALKLRLKGNIDNLGGIEDTVGVMQQSLADYEISNMVTRQYKEFIGKDLMPNQFAFYPRDSAIMQNKEPHEFSMHKITQQLEITRGRQEETRHPFQSVIDSQLADRISPEQNYNYKNMKILEDSKLLRQKKEMQLKKLI